MVEDQEAEKVVAQEVDVLEALAEVVVVEQLILVDYLLLRDCRLGL